MDSGFRTAEIAVVSDTRGHGFKSSHWQFVFKSFLILNVCWEEEKISEKRQGIAYLKLIL